MNKVLVVGTLCVLMLGSAARDCIASRLPVPYPSPLTIYLLDTINSERAAHGSDPLPLSKVSSKCAWRRSKSMAYAGKVSETKTIKNEVCQPFVWAGENVASIATGTHYWNDPKRTRKWGVLYLQTWMMSEGPCPNGWCTVKEWEAHGHYLNVIDKEWESVGIGIYHRHGILYLTEIYSTLHQWPIGP